MADQAAPQDSVQRHVLDRLDAIDLKLYVMEDRGSLRRNGHSIGAWVKKIVTPERIALGVLLIYQAGGRVQQMQNAVAEAVQIATEAKAINTEVLAHMREVDRSVMDLQQKQAQVPTKADVEALLNERLKYIPTRRELREQIEPVLARVQRIDANTKP